MPDALIKSAQRGALGVVALAAVGAVDVAALEMVPGGYGVGPVVESRVAPAANSEQSLADEAVGPSGLAIDFTPRDGSGFWSGSDKNDDIGGLRFDLNVTGTSGGTAAEQGFGASRDTLRAAQSGSAALMVGGAMHWSDWSVGGGLGRSQAMGTDVDLMAASLGYGRLTAQVAVGQSAPTAVDAPRDVLMLSTDLAAWSWLTLQSNLAVGSPSGADGDRDHNRDPVAAGTFGLRLNF